MNNLFVTGMFRSGTTLTGRAIHAHKDIALASDGLFPLFKSLRNAIAAGTGPTFQNDFEAPLKDYYFGVQREIYEAVWESSLDIPLEKDEAAKMRRRIADWSSAHEQYAPLLAHRVDEAEGASYREFLARLLYLVHDIYGNGSTRVTAFKEVWTAEFIPALARSFPDMRFLCIVRDPRGVFASKKLRESQYPPLFMARQWRKLAALSFLLAHDEALGPKVRLIRFEDLIAAPEKTARGICEFLDLDWDESMVHPERFVNGLGLPWLQNSAYNDGKAEFRTETIHRWKKYLSAKEVCFIDYLCGPEMNLFGYETVHLPGSRETTETLLAPPLPQTGELARWIRPFEEHSLGHTVTELGKEQIRHMLLGASPEVTDSDEYAELVRHCFLHKNIFRAIRNTYGK